MLIIFTVNDQKVTHDLGQRTLVAGSSGMVKAAFTFDNSWDGLDVVENGEAKQYQIKDTAGTLEPLGGLGDMGVATDTEVTEMLNEVFAAEEA